MQPDSTDIPTGDAPAWLWLAAHYSAALALEELVDRLHVLPADVRQLVARTAVEVLDGQPVPTAGQVPLWA